MLMNSEDRTDHTVNCECAICSDGSGYDDYYTPGDGTYVQWARDDMEERTNTARRTILEADVPLDSKDDR